MMEVELTLLNGQACPPMPSVCALYPIQSIHHLIPEHPHVFAQTPVCHCADGSLPFRRHWSGSMEKNILLIAYYWPPGGGIAVRRWLGMANAFSEMGMDVHVLTIAPESASYQHVIRSWSTRLPR